MADVFFPEQARPLARSLPKHVERFERGGRLLAFGRGAYATDAQHVSVEFVHPVIVGKRALPAMDFSLAFARGSSGVCGPTTSSWASVRRAATRKSRDVLDAGARPRRADVCASR